MTGRLLAFVAFLLGATAAVAAADSRTPRFVVYYNSDASPAAALVGLPYTHVILSFITARTGKDDVIEIQVGDKLPPALETVAALKADGKKVLISFGGGEMPAGHYRSLVGREKALAAAIAGFVKAHGLDGVDIDFEISEALHRRPPAHAFDGRAFLIGLTRELRRSLGPEAVLTHVPQGPYLDPAWQGGPYLAVLGEIGDLIDWITVQYYDNPGYNEPLGEGGSADVRPWTYHGLVGGRHGLKWPPQKTLVGKPIYTGDASNGYLPPADVLDRIVRPLVARYGACFGGLAGWQFSTLTDDHRFWNADMAAALMPASGASCAGG